MHSSKASPSASKNPEAPPSILAISPWRIAMGGRPSNWCLQLALPPFGIRPLAALRSVLRRIGEIALNSFVRMTPTLQRSEAETHDRQRA